MTYIPDLNNACPIGHGTDVRAVGWLHPDHPFATGRVPGPFVERLQQHLENAVQFISVMGAHLCEFCPAPTHGLRVERAAPSQPRQRSPAQVRGGGGTASRTTPAPRETISCVTCGDAFPTSAQYCGRCGAAKPLHYMADWGLRGATGYRNLWVPSADAVYIAPEMILHYVRGHSYRPPAEFVEAILGCPAQDSEDFMVLISRFKPKWDLFFFDRNAWAKREQSVGGRMLWSVFGRCAACGKFIYLYSDEEAPAHCGQPLRHFTRRHYDDSGKLIAETSGGSPQAPAGTEQCEPGESALGMGSWRAKGMCRVCGYWVYVDEDCELPMHCEQPLINTVYRTGTTRTKPC